MATKYFTLKNAAYVIAFVNLTLGIVLVVRSIAKIHNVTGHGDEKWNEEPDEQEDSDYYAVYLSSAIIGLFTAIGYVLTSTMLIQGLRTRNNRLAVPFLYWNYLSICFGFFLGIIFFVMMIVQGIIGFGFTFITVMGVAIGISAVSIGAIQKFVNTF